MGNLQTGPPAQLAGGTAQGPQAPKRPRLTDRADLTQPLTIDVSQTEPKRVSVLSYDAVASNALALIKVSTECLKLCLMLRQMQESVKHSCVRSQ